jgi:hypothetical protein
MIQWATLCVVPAMIAGCGVAPSGIQAILPSGSESSADSSAPRTAQEYESLVARIGAKNALTILNRRYRIMTTSRSDISSPAFPIKGRSVSTVYQLTNCTTTYLNVSGTHDTSTDPVIGKSCSTSYIDDGAVTGDGNGGDLSDPCAAAEDPAACYAATDKYPKYKSKPERDCEAQNGRFVTVNAGKTSDGGTRTDVGTKCVPWQMLLTPGAPTLFHQPGGCSGLDIEIAGIGIIIDAPGVPEQRSSTQVGVRVNSDCTTTWVPPSI